MELCLLEVDLYLLESKLINQDGFLTTLGSRAGVILYDTFNCVYSDLKNMKSTPSG